MMLLSHTVVDLCGVVVTKLWGDRNCLGFLWLLLAKRQT